MVRRPFTHPVKRFVATGSFAWLRDLDGAWDKATTLPGPGSSPFDWTVSLELYSLASGQASSLARRHKARHAVMVWNNDVRHPLYRLPPYRWALRRSVEADLVVCFVEAAADHCLGLGIGEERIALVMPPVDSEFFVPSQTPVQEPVIVYCSPIAPNKGIDRVLQAFAIVHSRIPDARLIVAGGGPMAAAVREAEKLTNGAVSYRGQLDREGVREVLQGGAVFCTAPRPTPVWNEQFGLAYAEAMACGLPVVTTACGSNHELVQPPNARVRDKPGDLADALCEFLDRPGLREEVGRQNRSWVSSRFDYRTQVMRLRDAFDR